MKRNSGKVVSKASAHGKKQYVMKSLKVWSDGLAGFVAIGGNFAAGKDGLMENNSGKVVSKKASARRKKQYVKDGLKGWADAVQEAWMGLGLTGFVAFGGNSAAGKALYAKAKSLL